MTYSQRIGARLRTRRQGLGYSVKELSHKADVGESTIYAIEIGNAKSPGICLLYALCIALSIKMEDIL